MKINYFLILISGALVLQSSMRVVHGQIMEHVYERRIAASTTSYYGVENSSNNFFDYLYSSSPPIHLHAVDARRRKINELSIGDGYISQNQIRGWVGPPILRGYISQPHPNTGALFLTYRHFLLKHFALGFTMGLDDEGGDLSHGNSFVNGGVEGVSGRYNVHAYSLAMEAMVIYNNSENDQVYGYVGMGSTVFDDKCVQYPNAPPYPFSLVARQYDYHTTPYTFQLTPIGFRFGTQLAGFVELGFGYKGIFNGGLSVRL